MLGTESLMATSTLRYQPFSHTGGGPVARDSTMHSSAMHSPPRPASSLRRSITAASSLYEPTLPPPKPAHTCPSCSRPFSRAEHLERHLATHLPSNSSKCFVCQSCLKGFTRKDVLTRHIRAVHETKRSDVRRSRRRSCKRCAGFKIKCSGGGRGLGGDSPDGTKRDEACEACKKRGVECIYDFGGPPEETEKRGSVVEDEEMEDVDEEMPSESAYSSRRGSDESSEQMKRRKTLDGSFPQGNGEALGQGYGHLRRSSDVSGILSPALATSPTQYSLRHDEASYNAASMVASLANINSPTPYMEPVPPERTSTSSSAKSPTSSSLTKHSFFTNTSISSPQDKQQHHPTLSPRSQTTSLSHLLLPHQPSSHAAPQLRPPPPFTSTTHPPAPTQHDHSGNAASSSSPSSLAQAGYQRILPNSFADRNGGPSRETHVGLADLGSSSSGPTSGSSVPVPGTSGALPSVSFLVGYGETGREGGYATSRKRSHDFTPRGSPSQKAYAGSQPQPQPLLSPRQDGTCSSSASAMQASLADPTSLTSLEAIENFFFDFSIFETDWLRGPVEPEPSQSGSTHPGESVGASSSASGRRDGNSSVNGAVPKRATSVSATNAHRHTGPSGIANSISTSTSYNSPGQGSKDGRGHHGEDANVYRTRRAGDSNFQLPSASPINEHSSLDDYLPWGWQSSRKEHRQQKITLPPLRQLLEECSTSTFEARLTTAVGEPPNSIISDRIREDFISLLSIPYERHPYEGTDIDMAKFPDKDVIDGFIQNYFKHFHAMIPVIHKPSFSAETCPTILLVAMASIGASYSEVEGARVFADTLSELCKRTLTWMADYNPAYLRSEFYLTAFCLQSFYALGCGNYRLYDNADATRSSLVSNARRVGLFFDATNPISSPPNQHNPGHSSPSSNLSSSGGSPILPSDTNLESRWHTWREQEKRKRLAWAIFEYDCCFSTLSNRRGSICLNEIAARLPCCEKMWEAPTAKAWAATLPPSKSDTCVVSSLAYRGIPFCTLMRDFTQSKSMSHVPILPMWAFRVCAQAMCRLLWDLKELEETALGGSLDLSGLGLSSLADTLSPTKAKLLSALTNLAETARNRIEEPRDVVHSNLCSLTAHYSHLHSSVPAISLILSLARHPTSTSDYRSQRLSRIFAKEPSQARMLAYHAGQILAITKSRPVYTPAETMRVFLAGVVLWGIARYTPPSSPSARHGEEGEHVMLDCLHSSNVSVRKAREWVLSGKGVGAVSVEGGGSVELCCERGGREVLSMVVGLLSSVRFWGLGEEFRRVLEGVCRTVG